MAVQLSLNPEQAKMLLPLLQMAVSSAGSLEAQRYSELPFQPAFSSTPNSSMDLDNSTSTFSMEELLTKAKKNTKSTDAQIELRFAVREAAKEVGLWDKAPYLENIPPKIMEDFYKTVFKYCPALSQNYSIKLSLRKRLSDTLMNRRQHLRKLEALPPPKRKAKHATPKTVSSSSHKQKMTSPSDSILGHTVEIMLSDGTTIGTGALLSVDEKDMFSKVVLKRISKGIVDEISLYEPIDDKLYFNDLQASDIFKWKNERLWITQLKTTIADQLKKFQDKGDIGNYTNEPNKFTEMSEYQGSGLNDDAKGRELNVANDYSVLQEAMNKGASEEQTSTAVKKNGKGKQKNQTAVKKTAGPKRKCKKQCETQKTAVKNITGKKRRSPYWYDIDSDSDQWKDEDIFSPTVLTNKRARKPSYKTMQL